MGDWDAITMRGGRSLAPHSCLVSFPLLLPTPPTPPLSRTSGARTEETSPCPGILQEHGHGQSPRWDDQPCLLGGSSETRVEQGPARTAHPPALPPDPVSMRKRSQDALEV